MKRKPFKVLCLLLALLFLFGLFTRPRLPKDLSAEHVCVVNASTGWVVLGKDAKQPIAPASTAKLLTALTALDYLEEDSILTAGEEALLPPADASKAGISPGNQLTVRQLLEALLLPSGSDAAYVLSVQAGRLMPGGGEAESQALVERFMEAANRKAKALGARSSNFVTPDGYDAPGQYSTARDLARIASAALDNATLLQIMGTPSVSQQWPSGQTVTLANSNQLINPNSPYYCPQALGLKTGSTSQAGACLISAVSVRGRTYICVVMGSTEEQRYPDMLKLFAALGA